MPVVLSRTPLIDLFGAVPVQAGNVVPEAGSTSTEYEASAFPGKERHTWLVELVEIGFTGTAVVAAGHFVQ